MQIFLAVFPFLGTVGYCLALFRRQAPQPRSEASGCKCIILVNLVEIEGALGQRVLVGTDEVWVVGVEVEPWVGFWTKL